MNIQAISKKTTSILNNNATFVFWLLLVLSLDYLVLFFIESILPGYVINHFNLNFLLLIILAGWLTLSIFSKKELTPKNFPILNNLFKISLLLIFFIGTWFTLYKIARLELLIYFLFLITIGYSLYKNK